MKIPGLFRLKKLKYKYSIWMLKSRIDVNPLNHYLVFSDPRGGSTWLMEIIKQITNKPIIWEPLHINKVPELKELGFGWRQYIPENTNWTEAKQFFNKLFKGKLLNKWLMQQTSKNELQHAEQFIIKFCRGNALLPYLTSNYNFKYKPILMVRHPFAVVASQLKHGGWKDVKSGFEIPETPYNDHYKEHAVFLNSLNKEVEVLIATWCITNQIPLSNSKNNLNWITITYEELLIQPEITINRILKEWQIVYDIAKINFKRQSSTTVSGSPDTVTERLHYWKESFTQEEIDAMTRVLNYFGVELYTNAPKPVINFNN